MILKVVVSKECLNGRMNLWILVVVYSLSGVPSVWTRDCSDIACIRNSEDLKANYKCDQLSVTGGHNSFLRYNLGSARNNIQAVYYNISIGNTNYTSELESTFTNECCNPSDKYCKGHLVYSSAIFYNIQPRMLYLLIFFHWTKNEDIFNYPQFCWSPSTFCDEEDVENILLDFTSEVFAADHQDLQDISSTSNYYIVLADSNLTPEGLLMSERTTIYIIPVLLFVVSGLTVILYINKKRRSIREILIHSSMARCSVRSLMIILWMGTILYLVQYFRTISYFDQNIDTNPTLHAYRDFFKLQAIFGFVHFAIFLTVFLMEAPFLCSIFYKMNEPIDLNHQKRKRAIIKVMIATLGHMGIVFFIQTLTVFMFYLAIFMFVAPLHGIILLSRGILHIALLFCILTRFQVMFLEKRKRVCSCTSIVKVLIVVIASITGYCVLGFWGSVFRHMHIHHNEIETTFKMDNVVHSIASSALLGVLGYICKKVIYQRVKRELDTSRNESERQPLISM